MASYTKVIGDIGESVIISEFLKHGINVLIPYDDNSTYDLVICVNDCFYKIQVKTTEKVRDSGGYMSFDITKSNPYSKIDPKYVKGEVDYFALYCIENEWCGLFEFDEYTPHMTFRLQKPKSGQVKNIKFAEDYLFHTQVVKFFNKEYIKDKIVHLESEKKTHKKKRKKKLCPICNKVEINTSNNMCRECYLKSRKNNESNVVNNKVICPVCNKNYKTKQAKMCIECKNRNIPTKEDLERLLYVKTFDEICDIYKKQASTIRKWYQKYNLPYTKTEINNLYNNRVS